MPGQAAQGGGFLGGLLVPFRPSEKEPVGAAERASNSCRLKSGNSRESSAAPRAANLRKPPVGGQPTSSAAL